MCKLLQVQGFTSNVIAGSVVDGFKCLLCNTGLGFLRPNIVLFGFKEVCTSSKMETTPTSILLTGTCFNLKGGYWFIFSWVSIDVRVPVELRTLYEFQQHFPCPQDWEQAVGKQKRVLKTRSRPARQVIVLYLKKQICPSRKNKKGRNAWSLLPNLWPGTKELREQWTESQRIHWK